MTPSPPNTPAALEGDAAVLRGVTVDREPRLLTRAARGAPRPASGGEVVASTGSAGAAAASPDPTTTALFRAGHAAGVADAERSHREGLEAEARKGFQEGFERGKREGFARGVEEGRAAGQREAETAARKAQGEAASRLGELDRLLAGLRPALAARLEASAADVVALCHEVVCRILGDLMATPAGVSAAVQEAIRRVADDAGRDAAEEAFVIHVHPAHLGALREDAGIAEWLERVRARGHARWVADEKVRMGGCIVRTPEGALDARLETQLASLRTVLTRAAEAEPAGPESPPGSAERQPHAGPRREEP